MSVLGVDVGSTRVHVAIAHEGRVLPVPSLDGLPYVPSVVGFSHDRPIVGAPALAHVLVSPTDVLFGPARYLGGGPVKVGDAEHAPEDLVALLLKHGVAAGLAMSNQSIDGVGLSRASWASPEARRALAEAAHRAGINIIRTEVSTTLAAITKRLEIGPVGRVLMLDAGGWKVEATVLDLGTNEVRALGRSVDATIGSNWIDGRLVQAVAHQMSPDDPAKLLNDRLCYAMLREQCESVRIQLSSQANATVAFPFLMPMLGSKRPAVWEIDRETLDALAQPLTEAIRQVCGEAMEHAGVEPGEISEGFVFGGLAHMPAVRETVKDLLGRPVATRGDLDGLTARGAAMLAEASLGRSKLRVIDDLDEHGRILPGAGWGHALTPSPVPTETPVAIVAQPPQPQPHASTPEAARPRRASPAPIEPHQAHASPRGGTPVPGTRPRFDSSPGLPQPHRRFDSSPELSRPERRSGEFSATAAVRPRAEASSPSPPPIPGSAARPPSAAEAKAPTPSPDTARPATADRGRPQDLGVAPEGAVRNPSSPAEMAATALDGTLSFSPPLSLAVLLLAIGRRKAFSGHLRLNHGKQEACVAIVRGGAAGSSLDLEQLRRAFGWPDAKYVITNDPPSSRQAATRQAMVGVVVHGIRSCLRIWDLEQVLGVLKPHMSEAPHMIEHRAALLPMLGLSSRELRFIEHALDGSISVDEILRRGGIGRETAVHLLFLMHLFRTIEWLNVADRPRETLADQLRRRASKLDKADHFEALGVHWSVSRTELERALRRIEEEMKPGGEAYRLDAEAATSILTRARQAYRAVAQESDRHAYLLEIHPDLDFEAIENVAEDQTQWYAFRGAAEAEHESSRLKKELLELSRMQHQPPSKPPR